MLQQFLPKLLLFLTGLGADPNDSDEVRLQRILMVTSVMVGFIVILLWGVVYWLFNEPQAAVLMGVHGVLSFVSLLLFSFNRQSPRMFYFCQHIIVFVMPVLVMLVLGGIVNSSLMIAWPLLAPIGMLVWSTTSEAMRWFVGYIALVILSIIVQPYLRSGNNLPLAVQDVLWGMNLIAPPGFIFFVLRYFVSRKDRFFQLLRQEQEKSETLLLNILPKEIAAALKNERRTIADQYDGVSILFADIVNFTPMSAQMTPTGLVDLLNEVFSAFDALAEKYKLEKIKTIGDCYMVASGVPRPALDHAKVLTHLALDMRDFVYSHTFNGQRLTFRIGLNSGPVVAGVIGRNKFIYDLWGDAVNTASRMESHGVSGVIQITEATYELIKDDFTCELQGLIKVKGKGEMKVWHVLAPKV
ncbi:MAG: adenylate/guanylate cyclase domain-containing protein [Candidatus Latescibacteria bacterium]|nr:adenylate/guanylate cyclase domain-containing protein [Candidatus Latescibacterota bacterium]